MGAWVGIHLIKYFRERIKGFIGIAPAPDFTEELMWKKFSTFEKKTIIASQCEHLKVLL